MHALTLHALFVNMMICTDIDLFILMSGCSIMYSQGGLYSACIVVFRGRGWASHVGYAPLDHAPPHPPI